MRIVWVAAICVHVKGSGLGVSRNYGSLIWEFPKIGDPNIVP